MYNKVSYNYNLEKKKLDFVSYIITAYNKRKYLQHVFQALAKEGGSHKREYIVVDDGSNDNTLVVLKNFAPKLPGKLIVIKRGNLDIPENSMAVIVPSSNKNNPSKTRYLPKPFSLRVDASISQERCCYNFEIEGKTSSYHGDFPDSMANLDKGSLLSFDVLRRDFTKDVQTLLLMMQLSSDAKNINIIIIRAALSSFSQFIFLST